MMWMHSWLDLNSLHAAFLLSRHSKKLHAHVAGVVVGMQRSEAPLLCAGLSDYPLFLHQKWFFPGNASKLRRHIRNLLLELFVEQLSEGQRESCSDAIAEAYQDITAYEEATERC